jgi:hypothetical protein
MNKMNFNPLVMFVVIPTVVQAGCLIFMGGAYAPQYRLYLSETSSLYQI